MAKMPGTLVSNFSVSTGMRFSWRLRPQSATGPSFIVRPKNATQGPLVPADLSGTIDPAVAQQADIIRVNVRDIQMGQLDKNILLRGGDVVVVPQAGLF